MIASSRFPLYLPAVDATPGALREDPDVRPRGCHLGAFSLEPIKVVDRLKPETQYILTDFAELLRTVKDGGVVGPYFEIRLGHDALLALLRALDDALRGDRP